jgi:hypothetical protein
MFLARIIHQAEKSTREDDFVIQMRHKTTVSQSYDAPKPYRQVFLTPSSLV